MFDSIRTAITFALTVFLSGAFIVGGAVALVASMPSAGVESAPAHVGTAMITVLAVASIGTAVAGTIISELW